MVKFVNKQVGKIFKFNSSKAIYHSINIQILDHQKQDYYPYVVRSSQNNGIRGYIKESTSGLNPANTISLAQDTAQFFYQDQPYFTGNKVKVLTPINFVMNKEIALYLISVMNKAFSSFGWGSNYSVDNLKPINIQVPVTPTGELDTAYMASYMQKIEASYMQKIEAYLAVLGYKSLADCQINKHDLDVLHAKPKMEKIKVNSLFSISKLKGLNKNDLHINNKGKYPYITRTAQNNGVESYTDFVDNDHLQPAGTFSLGLMQMSLFYQSKPWYNGQFVRKITPIKNYNSKELMFLQTHLQKLTNLFDPQAIRKVDDVFNKASFTLPVTSSGTPDWQFMEDYITAIEKLKVLKIKQFLDTKINAYQNIIK